MVDHQVQETSRSLDDPYLLRSLALVGFEVRLDVLVGVHASFPACQGSQVVHLDHNSARKILAVGEVRSHAGHHSYLGLGLGLGQDPDLEDHLDAVAYTVVVPFAGLVPVDSVAAGRSRAC